MTLSEIIAFFSVSVPETECQRSLSLRGWSCYLIIEKNLELNGFYDNPGNTIENKTKKWLQEFVKFFLVSGEWHLAISDEESAVGDETKVAISSYRCIWHFDTVTWPSCPQSSHSRTAQCGFQNKNPIRLFVHLLFCFSLCSLFSLVCSSPWVLSRKLLEF